MKRIVCFHSDVDFGVMTHLDAALERHDRGQLVRLLTLALVLFLLFEQLLEALAVAVGGWGGVMWESDQRMTDCV